MRKQFLIHLSAALLTGALLTASLSACEHKEVVLDNESVANFTEPAAGEEICVMTIKDQGDIKIRFFPDETEKGTENFKELVKSGFYDELPFHRIIDKFMIQGGDPKGDGTGGRDAWGGTGFTQTVSDHLAHVPGAVAYAINPQERLNKSQFYIVTGDEITDEKFGTLEQQGKKFSPFRQKLYRQFGGAPHLDGGYEIFGQVISGMDIVMQLQTVPTNSNNKPKTPVLIEKAVIVPYDGSGCEWVNWKGEKQPGINTEG